jgi:hypothetical protein
METNQQPIRTEAVKTVLTSSVSMDTIKACRELTDMELEFVRVFLDMNAPTPRAKRRDAGKPRVKPDQRSIAEISRGSAAQAS